MKIKQLSLIFILTTIIQFCPAQNAAYKPSDANLPANNANTPKTIKLFTSLAEGKKNANDSNTPQLLVLTNELQPAHEHYLKNTLSNPLFIDLTQNSLTAVKLDFPLKSNSTEEDVKEVAEFVKKYKILKAPLQFMLINTKTGEEIFRINTPADDPAVLVKNISQLLPDKYNGQWIDSFKAAQMISQKTGRHILINFTGSDWCIWCKKLKEEVFTNGVFKKYAAQYLVLVEIDFPRKKPLPQNKTLENNKLAEKFQINGYPSVIILDSTGKIAGRTGYVQGGVQQFMSELKQITGI